jgi:hypothetical protein
MEVGPTVTRPSSEAIYRPGAGAQNAQFIILPCHQSCERPVTGRCDLLARINPLVAIEGPDAKLLDRGRIQHPLMPERIVPTGCGNPAAQIDALA